MSQALTLSRAAQLVGVSRAALQRMVRSGELASSDGLVRTDELLRAFPQTRLEDSGMFEKVTRIREESFGRRVRERLLPSAEILSQRLFAQSQELTEVRRHLQDYHTLVTQAIERLCETPADTALVGETRDLLERGLARVLGSETDNPLDAMTEMLNVVCANVVVRPSGNEFLVEGNDTVLQAGLKAGLGFNYGCGGGNCGLCKARLISGEVRQILHSDYRLSAAEQQQGHVLLCTHTALSDLVIETLEASGPSDIPEQDLVAKIRAVQPLGKDTMLLHLQAPRSARLRFLAGQGATLAVPGGGADTADLQATYPIASCPCDDRNLLFHVARDTGDPFATQLFAGALRAGDPVGVHGPSGDFVLGAPEGLHLAFLACDTGFGPIKSLIEHAIAAESVERFSLYWLATRPDGHYLANQCDAWADAFDEFSYVALSDEDAAGGSLRLAQQAAQDNDIAASMFFIAGPAAFVDTAARGLREAGVHEDRLRTARA
jgi:CDP-4-dehydro-6-deoxyglucose reductase